MRIIFLLLAAFKTGKSLKNCRETESFSSSFIAICNGSVRFLAQPWPVHTWRFVALECRAHGLVCTWSCERRYSAVSDHLLAFARLAEPSLDLFLGSKPIDFKTDLLRSKPTAQSRSLRRSFNHWKGFVGKVTSNFRNLDGALKPHATCCSGYSYIV